MQDRLDAGATEAPGDEPGVKIVSRREDQDRAAPGLRAARPRAAGKPRDHSPEIGVGFFSLGITGAFFLLAPVARVDGFLSWVTFLPVLR